MKDDAAARNQDAEAVANLALRRHLAVSAALATAAAIVFWIWPSIGESLCFPHSWERRRAALYFVALYATAVPMTAVHLAKGIRKPGFTRLATTRGDIVLRSLLTWTFCPAMVIAPFFIIVFEPSTVVNRFLLNLLISTPLGLALLGTVLTFGASIFLWLMLLSFRALYKGN